MFLPTDPHQRTLQAQHTLDQDDWLSIYAIAQAEDAAAVPELLESFSFEQFFGFACHLFVTVRSRQSRAQVAKILPKFGSIAVYPLLKVAYHFKDAEDTAEQDSLAQAALSCLRAMPQQALIIGLANAVQASISANSLAEVVIMPMIRLIAHHPKTLLSLLSRQLDADSWNILSAHLIGALSDLKKARSTQNPAAQDRADQLDQLEINTAEQTSVAC